MTAWQRQVRELAAAYGATVEDRSKHLAIVRGGRLIAVASRSFNGCRRGLLNLERSIKLGLRRIGEG